MRAEEDGRGSRRNVWAALILLVLVVAGGLGVTLSGGAKRADAPVPVPRSQGELLRERDTAAKLAGIGSEADYDHAFVTLAARCQEQDAELASEVDTVLWLLQHNGVDGENRLTVMRTMADPLPIGQKQTCSQVADGYVTVQEESHRAAADAASR
ncbi:hypothetical protein OG455_25900 [Kitasatospora sp. NBC_01287]|uniref:hypothetical protein n=1 Tax=Kitasatospora sp. NBC_01287 TaxID=2903573 RepID=UPI0022543234|nr:hypothetical protein [Kitasatospora sp. NBC_01287]MCX4748909.1 hypothetical protein [Kitasatospora sp. NBC_01287]